MSPCRSIGDYLAIGDYLVPLGGGVVGDVEDESDAGGVADGDLVVSDGYGVVAGDADGVRSPGRSPVRPLGDSVHAAARVVTRARRQKPLRNFFIGDTSRDGFDPAREGAIEMPTALTERVKRDRWCTLEHRCREFERGGKPA
jgi:hypothetical protein